MSRNEAVYLLAVALFMLANGAIFLADRPAWSKRAKALWAVAIIFLTAVLTNLTAALTLHWF
jgi:hypothetical protein